MNQGWVRASFLGFLLIAVTLPAWGQTTAQPEAEYKKLIRVDQAIHPLGAHPFGENINLYNGDLSFLVTDVSAKGKGPVLRLTRKFHLKGVYDTTQDIAEEVMGDWAIDLPRMQTLVTAGAWYVTCPSSSTTPSRISGWVVDNGYSTNSPCKDIHMRCQNFGPPPEGIITGYPSNVMSWGQNQWWQDYHLIIPGQGSQTVLQNTDSLTNGTYPAVTKNHWRLSCINETSTANGQPGDGFIAHAPDGSEYYFNELTYGAAQSGSQLVQDPNNPTNNISYTIARHVAFLLVTKIVDRFGNSLTYSYDSEGRLSEIQASDGRDLTIQYGGTTAPVQSVTLQPASGSPRTWTYTYTTLSSGVSQYSLTTVTLPDNSAWQYQLSGFDNLTDLSQGTGTCNTLSSPSSLSPVSATIVHPSGLTGTFTVQPVERGRSYVRKLCANVFGYNTADTIGTYAFIPKQWYGFSIISRKITGAGLPTAGRTWQYDYSSPNSSWITDSCASTNSCPTTVWTEIVNPDGSMVKRTFSNKFDASESKLLSTKFFASTSASTPLRIINNSYANPAPSPIPSSAGTDLYSMVNLDQATTYSPLQERVITQDGDTYTWLAEAYDEYAQVTKEKRSNTIAGQATDESQTTYYNDTNLWVLGLPLQTDDLTTGVTTNRYVYNTSNDTLVARYHFCSNLISDPTVTDDNFTTCNRVMSYTWNGAGQLASFTDGKGNTTSLSNYMRGIPQLITYPDSTTETLSVDDLGQIDSITDQAGNTTTYQYDGVGRVTQIDYPTGDPLTWNPTTFTYTFVTGSERGITGAHWRRTISTGNASKVTYFDALLEPVLSESYDSTNASTDVTRGTSYNWRGQATFQSYPVAGSPDLSALTTGTHTLYDALGRTTEVDQDSEQGTLATKISYLSGARKQVTDPNGNATTTSYQVFDAPSYHNVIEVQAPDSVTQTITRNVFGDPTSIQQSSVTKTLTYDSFDRLCRTTEPESGSTLVSYDAAGNIAWSAAGQSITGSGCGYSQVSSADEVTRSYDAMNRVLSIDYPTGTNSTRYTYDSRGNVASATSGSATWTYVHDKRNLLASETLNMSGNPSSCTSLCWSFNYGYDPNGNLASITYPDGKIVDYAPNALGQPAQAGAFATNVTYGPDGSIDTFQFGNGATYQATKNARLLLSELKVTGSGGNLVYDQSLAYDPNANLLSTTDNTATQIRTETFTYDALNRLTSADAPNQWGMETYTYDTLNNITSIDSDGVDRIYNYNANNLLSSITSGTSTGALIDSFSYDAQGNTTSKNSTNLVFDKANRLQQVVGKDSYAYDASGRRVEATPSGGTPTYYAYSSAGQLLYQYDAATQGHTDYIYLGKLMLAKVDLAANDPTLNPQGVNVNTTPNNGSYTISWTGESGVTSYELQESANGGAWSTVYTGTSLSQSFSGKAGGAYDYRMRECAGGCGEWGPSTEVDVTPAQPQITVPTTLQSGSYTVSWTIPISTTSVTVQEQYNGGTWTTIASNTTATSISRPGTTDGSYIYRVEALNTYGTRGWTTSGTVTVLHAPAGVPTETVPSSSSNGSYTVSWTSVSNTTSYTLQEQVNGGAWSTIYSGSALSDALSGRSNGTYGYRVQACNAAGCAGWSTTQSISVLFPPPTPSSITVPSTSSGTVTVSWASASTATSYTLQHQLNGGSWGTVFSGNATSTPVTEGTSGSYVYRVEACNGGGCSAYKTSGTVTVTIPPPTPSSITVPSTSNGVVAVSWAGSSGATSYTLQHQLNSGSWSTVFSGIATSTSVTEGTSGSYVYRVEACNGGGCSAYKTSGTVTVTIPPPTPSSITVPSTSNGVVAVSWAGSSGATSYTLQHQLDSGSWSTVYSGNANTSSVTETTSGNYVYRVQACNSGGCSAFKSSTTVTVILPPQTPTTLSVTLAHQAVVGARPPERTSLYLTWSSTTNASSYQYMISVNGGAMSTPVYTTATSYSVNVANTTTSAQASLRACNSAGACSAWEGPIQATVVNN